MVVALSCYPIREVPFEKKLFLIWLTDDLHASLDICEEAKDCYFFMKVFCCRVYLQESY